MTLLKDIPSGSFDSKKREWFYPLRDIRAVENKLYKLDAVNVSLDSLPHNIVEVLLSVYFSFFA